MIKQYDSVLDLLRDAQRLGQTWDSDPHGSSWTNHESAKDTERLTERGDLRLVPEAEKLLAKLETEIDVPKKVWERNVAGPRFNIPEYLAGYPTCARRLTRTADEFAPIKIIVCSSCSAGISASDMMKRGTTILALVLALSRSRPISLWTVATLHGQDDGETVLSARINTDPLDTATAAYVLTSAGFSRNLTFGLGRKINRFNGSWPKGFNYSNPEPYLKKIVTALSDDPERTLIIKPTHLRDPILSDPIKWLNEQVTRFIGQTEDLVS